MIYEHQSQREYGNYRFKASQFCLFICLLVFYFPRFGLTLVAVALVGFHHHNHSKERTQKEEMLTTLSSCVRHAVPGRSENREKVRGEKKKR